MDKGATGDAVVHALAAASTAIKRTLLVSSHQNASSLQSTLHTTQPQQRREQQAAPMVTIWYQLSHLCSLFCQQA
jgi:hypothetical protein